MDTIIVQRRDFSKKAKHLRRLGIVPCNIFGGSLKAPIAIQMDEVTARKLVRFKREGSKLQLKLENQMIPVQIKEKEQNAINNEIIHMNFQALLADQKVNSVIHMMLKNTDKVPGIIERMLIEVPYASLPEDMIDTLTIDLEDVAVGTVFTIEDIPELMDERIELQVDKSSIILRINERTRAAEQVLD